MRKPIHLVCDSYTRYVVKSVLKRHREKGFVQVIQMNGLVTSDGRIVR